MKSREQLRQRDAEIARALANDGKVKDLMGQYGLSRSQVYRAGKNGQREAFATGVSAAGEITGERSQARVNLYSEMGRSGLKRFGGSVDDDYDRIFRTLRQRVALYREMGDDPVVAAVMQAVKMTLRRVSWYVETDGETAADLEAKEFLESCLDDMSHTWTDVIEQALGMLQYGFYPSELVYKPRRGPDERRLMVMTNADGQPRQEEIILPGSKYTDGRLGWRKWVFMAPESLAPGDEWQFDPHGGLEGLRQQAPPDYPTIFIPIEKAVLFRTTAERGNPEGRSILRAMWWPWYLKKNLEEIEAITAERTGAGFPVIYMGDKTGKNADDANSDLSVFKDMVRNIRADEQAGAIIPYAKMGGGAREGEGVLLEFVRPPGQTMDFGGIITRHEQRMAMVGLAQFIHLGMNQVGARSLGESSQDFFTLAVSAWADGLADTINRFAVDRLFKLNNFPGLTVTPRLAHESVSGTDIGAVAEYINKLANANLLTPTEDLERHMLEMADLPQSAKITELWEAKEKARESGLALAQRNGPPGQQQDEDEKPPVDEGDEVPEDGELDETDDAAVVAAIRRGIRAVEQAESFSEMEIPDVKANALLSEVRDIVARGQAAQPPFSLTLKEGTVELPENFGQQLPPQVTVDMRPVAEMLERFLDRPAPEMPPPAPPPAVHVTAQIDTGPIADVLRSAKPPVVNVAAPPAPIVTMPPINLEPVADAIREVGTMSETIEIARSDAGLIESATKRRRRKGA